MTPAETAAVLRQYNAWRRGNLEDLPQPDSREIGEAIDAAVEMIDRLEAAEKDAAHQKALAESALRVAGGWERKCGDLRAKIEAMERQEPVAWLHETRRDSDVVTDAVKHVWGKAVVGALAAYSIPLYLAPGAQPAPSVPDEIKRDVLRACCGTFHGSRHRITCERYKGKKAPEAKP